MGNTGNRIMPERHSAVGIGFAMLAMVLTTSGATADRDEDVHEYGTDPARTWYPDSAINSTNIPITPMGRSPLNVWVA